MKQTAIEWLEKQLRDLSFNKNTHLGLGDIRVTQGFIDEIVEKAKQMELAQRIEDYNNGHTDRQKNIFRLPTKNIQ